VDNASCGAIGDPLAFARACSDATIKAGGNFERDHGAACDCAAQEPIMIVEGLITQQPRFNSDASGAQHLRPQSVDPWITVRDRNDHTGNASVNQSLGTRWGFAVMGAGF
jgi:hypothetical protein